MFITLYSFLGPNLLNKIHLTLKNKFPLLSQIPIAKRMIAFQFITKREQDQSALSYEFVEPQTVL